MSLSFVPEPCETKAGKTDEEQMNKPPNQRNADGSTISMEKGVFQEAKSSLKVAIFSKLVSTTAAGTDAAGKQQIRGRRDKPERERERRESLMAHLDNSGGLLGGRGARR